MNQHKMTHYEEEFKKSLSNKRELLDDVNTVSPNSVKTMSTSLDTDNESNQNFTNKIKATIDSDEDNSSCVPGISANFATFLSAVKDSRSNLVTVDSTKENASISQESKKTLPKTFLSAVKDSRSNLVTAGTTKENTSISQGSK